MLCGPPKQVEIRFLALLQSGTSDMDFFSIHLHNYSCVASLKLPRQPNERFELAFSYQDHHNH